jgi:hypothetical protein
MQRHPRISNIVVCVFSDTFIEENFPFETYLEAALAVTVSRQLN